MEWQERHLGASARGLMPVQMSVSRVHPSFGAFLPAGLLRLNLMLPITRLFSAISPPYRDRVQLYNFDIWSKSVDLMIEAPGYRDGRDWTRQVPKRAAGEHPHIQAITIDDLIDAVPIDANLIENSGLSKLSLPKKGFLLKMDIADQTAGR